MKRVVWRMRRGKTTMNWRMITLEVLLISLHHHRKLPLGIIDIPRPPLHVTGVEAERIKENFRRSLRRRTEVGAEDDLEGHQGGRVKEMNGFCLYIEPLFDFLPF